MKRINSLFLKLVTGATGDKNLETRHMYKRDDVIDDFLNGG